MLVSDTDLLNYVEGVNPGARDGILASMQQAGVQPRIPACGLCAAPVENGCEHVVPFSAKRVSMRQMVRRRCRNCTKEWVQPARRGACPDCFSRDVLNLDEQVCSVPRA